MSLVCGIAFVAAMISLPPCFREYQAVASLQKSGASVYFDYRSASDGKQRRAADKSRSPLRDCLFYDVDAVTFTYLAPATDNSVLPLADLPDLQELLLSGTGVTDVSAELLSRIPTLRSATFSDTSVTGAGLQQMSRCTRLRSISLSGSTINDAAMQGLKEWPALKHIQVVRANITNESLQSLGAIRTLRGIDLWEAGRIDDEGVSHLRSLTDLESLHILNAPITDKTLRICSSWKSLKFLRFNSPQITDEGMAALQGLTSLERVGLSCSSIQNLEVLAALPQLKTLELAETQISDASIEVLSRSPSIRSLSLQRTGLTDRSLEHLAALSTLRELTVGPNISESAARKLHEDLPECMIEGIDERGGYIFRVPSK